MGVPASLDLSSVEWAFWDPILTGSQISAGVKPLNLVWRGTGFSYLFSINGPTILLFRPKTDLREWIANPDHIQKEPESFNTLKYLHIPADWVLDIANFVSSTSTVAYTRIPSSMDVSPGIATSGGSGLAMRRKYEQEGKRFRWKDSNNTAEDFEKTPPSLKR